MKRPALYLALGGLAFLIFLTARLPAAVIIDRLPPGWVDLTGVQGTVWRGSADRISAQGLLLGTTTWRFRFTNLIRAELAYDFATNIGGQPLSGVVASSGGGKTRLADVSGNIALSDLAAFMPTGFFDGLLMVQAKEVTLKGDWPVSVDGRFELLNLRALTTRPPTLLGDFEIIFDRQQEPALTAELRELQGPIELQGQLVLEEGKEFRLDARLAPQRDAGNDIRNMLNFLGPPDQQGKHRLSHSGRL